MACMIALTRVPDLKACSCRAMYSAPCPARLGLAGIALFPPAPWHATHSVDAVCAALSVADVELPPAAGAWPKATAGRARTNPHRRHQSRIRAERSRKPGMIDFVASKKKPE
jgi:hypothetical protein